MANTATNGPTIDLFLPLGPMLGFILRPWFCSDGLKCEKNQMALKCLILNKQKSKFNLLSTSLGNSSESPIITVLMFALHFSDKIMITIHNEIIAKISEGTLLFL